MKLKLISLSLSVAGLLASANASAAVCPAIGSSSGCSVVITRNLDGSFTTTQTGVGPYDGGDDTLIGVVNNGSGNLTSLTLSSTTDIFGFDGDGIDQYVGGGKYGPTGYEGPNTSFTVVDAYHGVVNFLNGGIASGATAYFGLEEDLSGSVSAPVTIGGGTVTPVPTSAVPEPGVWAMMIAGFGVMGATLRRRKAGAAVRPVLA